MGSVCLMTLILSPVWHNINIESFALFIFKQQSTLIFFTVRLIINQGPQEKGTLQPAYLLELIDPL